MDTLRERMFLEKMWKDNPVWKVWKESKKIFTPARKIQNLHGVGDKHAKNVLLER
jgi:hypothetical protein